MQFYLVQPGRSLAFQQLHWFGLNEDVLGGYVF